jgi:hypothetical protein
MANIKVVTDDLDFHVFDTIAGTNLHRCLGDKDLTPEVGAHGADYGDGTLNRRDDAVVAVSISERIPRCRREG